MYILPYFLVIQFNSVVYLMAPFRSDLAHFGKRCRCTLRQALERNRDIQGDILRDKFRSFSRLQERRAERKGWTVHQKLALLVWSHQRWASSRVTRLGDFSPIGLLLRFQKWFIVDVLGFQIELCRRYFWPFFDLATFWAIF